MTYSIVARDSKTGELGVGVQTCMFAVGSVVPWAEAGVGAVATQAMSEVAYGWRCLAAMKNGASAPEALEHARAQDQTDAIRQVGVVDALGNVAAFTGDLCIDFAGHYCGDGYTVQANMMATDRVWPAMAEAYEHASGSLAERMLAALVAGESAGGDARGAMSAALVVVDRKATPGRPSRATIDVRVDDHPDPLDELVRLVRVAEAFRAYGRGTDSLFGGDPEGALRELEAALDLLPDDENLQFLYSGALIFSGRVDEGQAITRKLVAARPSWETIIRSFANKGLLPVPDGLDIDSFVRD
jgi:uncharacterized Ntn-hydrolase superfamily protein